MLVRKAQRSFEFLFPPKRGASCGLTSRMQFFFSTYERLIRDAPLKASSLKDKKNKRRPFFLVYPEEQQKGQQQSRPKISLPQIWPLFPPFSNPIARGKTKTTASPIHSFRCAAPSSKKRSIFLSSLLLRRRQHTNPIFIACFAFWAFFSHAHLRMRKKNFPSKQSVAGGRREEKKRCPLLR